MEQYRNVSAENMGQENNIMRPYHKAETVNRICKDGSALHSVSLLKRAIPKRSEKAQYDIGHTARKKAWQYNVIGNRY